MVNAARRALESDDVDVVLPFVPADGEQEVSDAFQLVRKARRQGAEACCDQIEERLAQLGELRRHTSSGTQDARVYTSAMHGFLVWSHKLWKATLAAHHA